MSPLVSVIIPTYNRGQYIQRAIESVLAQTYQNLEVLVIDDGSTDLTREIVSSIKDQRVRYFYTSNRGNYFARNEGLQNARGEFVSFLDSDDVFMPQKLARQIEQFHLNPELGLCCSNLYVRHDNLPGKLFEDKAHAFDQDFETKDGFIEQAVKGNFIATSTVLIRKMCVERVGLFDTRYQNAMDYEYFLRIIFNFPAKYLKEKLVERLIHPCAVSKNSVLTANSLVYIFSDCARRFEQGKLFIQRHKKLLNDAKEKSFYLLGMEYLLGYNFDKAHEVLSKCQYRPKWVFTFLAKIIARFHLSVLIFLIAQYRRIKNYFSLHDKPSILS